MLRRMLRVNNWLDVAPPKNMEEDHSFLFLKKNLMKFFFFFWKIWKSLIFSRNWKFWLMIFFFFGSSLRSTSPMPLVPRRFLKISFFFFFERFTNNWFFFFFFFEIWRFVHYQKVKRMKMKMKMEKKWWRFIHDDFIFLFFYFFFEKPILWMRITLAWSLCRLLDKSLLNSCKKIISISNGFIHWNELEVLTQCP